MPRVLVGNLKHILSWDTKLCDMWPSAIWYTVAQVRYFRPCKILTVCDWAVRNSVERRVALCAMQNSDGITRTSYDILTPPAAPQPCAIFCRQWRRGCTVFCRCNGGVFICAIFCRLSIDITGRICPCDILLAHIIKSRQV